MPDTLTADIALSLAALAQDNRSPQIAEYLDRLVQVLAAQAPQPVTVNLPAAPAAPATPAAPQGDLIVTVTRTAAGRPVEYRITRA